MSRSTLLCVRLGMTDLTVSECLQANWKDGGANGSGAAERFSNQECKRQSVLSVPWRNWRKRGVVAAWIWTGDPMFLVRQVTLVRGTDLLMLMVKHGCSGSHWVAVVSGNAIGEPEAVGAVSVVLRAE